MKPDVGPKCDFLVVRLEWVCGDGPPVSVQTIVSHQNYDEFECELGRVLGQGLTAFHEAGGRNHSLPEAVAWMVAGVAGFHKPANPDDYPEYEAEDRALDEMFAAAERFRKAVRARQRAFWEAKQGDHDVV